MDEKLLISAVKEHPTIYDRSRSDFKDVAKRRLSWDIISKTINTPVNQCMRMWRNVRERYGRELKILRNTRKDSASTIHDPRWDLFEHLSFLMPHIKSRRRAAAYSNTFGKLDELVLIETVERHPILYDKYHVNFKDVLKKEDCWNEIAKGLDATANECEHAWKNLRERYAKERKRLQFSQAINSKWPLYEKLIFLDNHIKPRRTNNSIFNAEAWNCNNDIIANFDVNHKTEAPDFEFVEESQVLDDVSEVVDTSERATLSNCKLSPIASSSILVPASKVAKLDHTNDHGYLISASNNYVELNNPSTSSDIAFGNYVGQYLSEIVDVKKKNKLKLSIMQILHGDE